MIFQDLGNMVFGAVIAGVFRGQWTNEVRKNNRKKQRQSCASSKQYDIHISATGSHSKQML